MKKESVILVGLLVISIWLLFPRSQKTEMERLKAYDQEHREIIKVSQDEELNKKLERLKREAEEYLKNPVEKDVQYMRLTSYYTGDNTGSSNKVGVGLTTKNFTINEKGWYEYKGKLVLAGATNECLKVKKGACGKYNVKEKGKHYYNYYDEVILEIDGIEYEGIILDSCGASMWKNENRIDLFVSNKNSMIDRGYKGIDEVKVVNK